VTWRGGRVVITSGELRCRFRSNAGGRPHTILGASYSRAAKERREAL
jgi:hypothetical protein